MSNRTSVSYWGLRPAVRRWARVPESPWQHPSCSTFGGWPGSGPDGAAAVPSEQVEDSAKHDWRDARASKLLGRAGGLGVQCCCCAGLQVFYGILVSHFSELAGAVPPPLGHLDVLTAAILDATQQVGRPVPANGQTDGQTDRQTALGGGHVAPDWWARISGLGLVLA
jgi:hypothetical protein